jgi:hypothetical protein
VKETDLAWLGGMIGGEGGLRYRKHNSSFGRHSWQLQLKVNMGEEEYIRRIAELCGASYRIQPNGKYWEVYLFGRRALNVLMETRSYLLGFKAEAADLAKNLGPSVPGSLPHPVLPSLRGKTKSNHLESNINTYRSIKRSNRVSGVKQAELAWLGGLTCAEAGLRYKKVKSRITTPRKTYTYFYWRLQLRIEMGEESYVRRFAELCGVTYRKEPHVEYWEVVLGGRKALELLRAMRPYLWGLKAQGADIALRVGSSIPGMSSRPILPSLKGKKWMDREGIEPSA